MWLKTMGPYLICLVPSIRSTPRHSASIVMVVVVLSQSSSKSLVSSKSLFLSYDSSSDEYVLLLILLFCFLLHFEVREGKLNQHIYTRSLFFF